MRKPKTLPKLKQEALNLYAKVVKLRSYNEGKLYCFTCGAKLELNSSNCHLGHFLPRGAYPGLTFHPENSRLQCYRCNVHLHGNTIEFRQRLINEIGIDAVEKLEFSRHNIVKWSRSELLNMILFFKNTLYENDIYE